MTNLELVVTPDRLLNPLQRREKKYLLARDKVIDSF